MRRVGGALWDLTDKRSNKDTGFVGQLPTGTLRFTYKNYRHINYEMLDPYR